MNKPTNNKLTTKQIRKYCTPGRWVRTHWVDAGATDCIVIDNDKVNTIKGFDPNDGVGGIMDINYNQISEIGNFVKATDSGLSGNDLL